MSKSGNKTPCVGYFWSRVAGSVKWGLEILGIGIIDADEKDCGALDAVQTSDDVTSSSHGKNLVDWHVAVLESRREQLHSLTKNIVADAFFSKETFVTPMIKTGYTAISRLRNESVLYYPTIKERTDKRGRPTVYDGKNNFNNLDLSTYDALNIEKGRLFTLKVCSY